MNLYTSEGCRIANKTLIFAWVRVCVLMFFLHMLAPMRFIIFLTNGLSYKGVHNTYVIDFCNLSFRFDELRSLAFSSSELFPKYWIL